MMCDFIIAADTAKFGQPEIKLGVIPGAGGTQRLPRAVGKSKVMDMVLISCMVDAAEAERAGLVSCVVPADRLITEALSAAATICGLTLPSVMMAKEVVNRAFEAPLGEGVWFELGLFLSLFGTADQQDGMAAFLAKRPPAFKHHQPTAQLRLTRKRASTACSSSGAVPVACSSPPHWARSLACAAGPPSP